MPLDYWPEMALQRDTLQVDFNGNHFKGYMVAPADGAGPKPMVIVIHNYQGLKFFDVDVAEYFARIGYVGLAIDLYGETVPEDERVFPSDPELVPGFQKKCFEGMVAMDHDHQAFRDLMLLWLETGLKHPLVESSVAPAAIGYCFGGMAVLEAVRGGLPFGGVVSLHGLLQTGEDPNAARNGAVRPPLKTCANHYNTNTVVVIENGANDELVPDESKQRFFAEMNDAGVDWTFNHHAHTPHGFALPPTLGPPGRLYEPADRRSTVSMLALFREIFPGYEQQPVSHNASGTKIPL
jgi:dienelactone hydrolase